MPFYFQRDYNPDDVSGRSLKILTVDFALVIYPMWQAVMRGPTLFGPGEIVNKIYERFRETYMDKNHPVFTHIRNLSPDDEDALCRALVTMSDMKDDELEQTNDRHFAEKQLSQQEALLQEMVEKVEREIRKGAPSEDKDRYIDGLRDILSTQQDIVADLKHALDIPPLCYPSVDYIV